MHADPISVFEAVVDALRRGDWLAVADLCDPVSLILHRHVTIISVTPRDPPPPTTVEEMQDLIPQAPLEVLEHMVAAFDDHAESGPSQLELQLFEVESIEAVHRMTPREVFVSRLKRRANPLHLMGDPYAKRSMQESTTHSVAIGVVMEGERVAYVVYHVVDPQAQPDAVVGPDWVRELTPEERERYRYCGADYWQEHPYVTTCLQQPDGSWRIVADQLPDLGMRMFDADADSESES